MYGVDENQRGHNIPKKGIVKIIDGEDCADCRELTCKTTMRLIH